MASIPILNASGLVMVSSANTYPGLTRKVAGVQEDEPERYYAYDVRNYARTVPADDWQGIAAAKWAKQLGVRKAAVVNDGQRYGVGLQSTFIEAATANGIQIVGSGYVDTKGPRYRDILASIAKSGPELVFYAGTTDTDPGTLFKDLRSTLGPNVKLMGGDGIYEEAFLKAAGAAAEGVYVTFGGAPPNKLTGAGADWRQAYVDRFDRQPEVYASYAYDATRVVLKAIEAVGSKDRAAIRDAVMSTADFEGLLGTFSFDANGDVTASQMSGRQIRNGRFDDTNAVLIPVP